MLSRKSSNPFLSEKSFLKNAQVIDGDSLMTVSSTLNKFGFLLFLLLTTSILTWTMFSQGVNVQPYVIASAIIGFIVAIVVSFRPRLAQYLAPLYALLEGVVVGGISALFSFSFKGINDQIIIQAVFLTISVILAMFILYRFRIIRVTQQLRSMIMGAVVGVMVFYVINMLFAFFGDGLELFSGNGTLSIIISGVIVLIAAFMLLLDFDRIEQGAQHGAPKYMEWFAAFGLLVTIIWIYIEVLRLIAKLSSSKN